MKYLKCLYLSVFWNLCFDSPAMCLMSDTRYNKTTLSLHRWNLGSGVGLKEEIEIWNGTIPTQQTYVFIHKYRKMVHEPSMLLYLFKIYSFQLDITVMAHVLQVLQI